MALSALPTARFDRIAPAGFELLRALASVGYDFVITSGTDGAHSGPDDPHHLGCAYDVRSHDFSDERKQDVLFAVMCQFEGTPIRVLGGGWTTPKFFGWLEAAGTPNEHFHFQLRHGREYP